MCPKSRARLSNIAASCSLCAHSNATTSIQSGSLGRLAYTSKSRFRRFVLSTIMMSGPWSLA
ncbi:hypothetical protein PF005_g33537 [Phytophthora fragariae]|uniref:Uncharacterized protein n=1 Tax=Phytophthora fragariae TaxID=53985 RepID=A0A6A3UE69_9STRA|nr:hypothetical protein PF003_g29724 [Phytophthora fragariae]KAE9054293.1 hypothetical protein PF006_g33296 [Phytophthora fragariae]KAE9061633.1 hypothetical protein PF007_g30189 [Phytophthora fragariae]KAE9149743.1 hypothetical protein PF005_g33537 [Phytophthora fragariae]KAE9268275.1 hypothetical protein PF001_g29718 [Phytophthora fragariae]